jgi:hypothetical protein
MNGLVDPWYPIGRLKDLGFIMFLNHIRAQNEYFPQFREAELTHNLTLSVLVPFAASAICQSFIFVGSSFAMFKPFLDNYPVCGKCAVLCSKHAAFLQPMVRLRERHLPLIKSGPNCKIRAKAQIAPETSIPNAKSEIGCIQFSFLGALGNVVFADGEKPDWHFR